jgi:hypothetical protein
MNRTILAIATALLSATTLFASSAQACISCNYVPEVVNTPHPAHAKKKRVIVAKEQAARPAKKRIAKTETAKLAPVAKKAEPKKIETAAAEPVQAPAVAEAPAAATTEAPVERPVSASTLLQGGGAKPADKPAEETKVAEVEPVGCKRFIPTAGVTITVPCE